MKPILLLWLLVILPLEAATWYVDSGASGANNGTSWTDAWTDIDSANGAGVSAGDTVYISGGPSGSTRSYSCDTLGAPYKIWVPKSGSAGLPITYQIGQDNSHNGTALFVGNLATGGDYWLGYQGGLSHVIISGDAGDNVCHFAITNYNFVGVGQSWNDVRVSYTTSKGASSTYGAGAGLVLGGIDWNPGSAIEFDHNIYTVFDKTADHFSYASFSGTGTTTNFAANSFHHNTISVGKTNSGLGMDILQWNGSGFSIYANVLTAYDTNYTGGQHGDGWQATGSQWAKIYGNTWVGIPNYAIFGDSTSGGITNLWVYNEKIINCGAGVIIGADGAAVGMNFVGIVEANNTVDSGTNATVICAITGKNSATFSNCIMKNNVGVDGVATPFDTTGTGGGVSTNANYILTQGQATTNFVNYAGQDYHLANGSVLIGVGTDLSAYFTTDFAGATRTVPWTSGAYIATVAATQSPLVISGRVVTGGRVVMNH